MISGGIFSSNVIPNYNNIAYRRLTKWGNLYRNPENMSFLLWFYSNGINN
jgi:hypothetical protein